MNEQYERIFNLYTKDNRPMEIFFDATTENDLLIELLQTEACKDNDGRNPRQVPDALMTLGGKPFFFSDNV